MKWLKIISGLLVGLILVAVVAFVLLATFVSPNRFKPMITEQVKKYTGREITIDGDLSWTIFPSLGVKVGHLVIANPSEFQQKTFAEIESVTVEVRALPLLHGKIHSNGIAIKNLKLNLITNADGKSNWQDLGSTTSTDPVGSSSAKSQEEAPATPQKNMKFDLAVAGVNISNASINVINEKTKKYFNVDHLDLHVNNMNLTQPFPFTISFDYSGKNPDLAGKISLSSIASLNLNTRIYRLEKMDLNTDMQQGARKINLVLRGDANADLAQQELLFDNINAEVANLNAAGKVEVTNLLSSPKTTGHLSIQPFDVKKWLQATGQDTDTLKVCNNLSGDFDFAAGTSLQSVTMQGNLKIDQVQAANMHLTQINMPAHFQKGVLQMSPTASFYQGNLQGQAKVDLNVASPQISIQGKLANVQMQPLLADLGGQSKIKVSGTGNVDLQVTTSGTSSDAIVKNLNGSSKINLADGTLQGVDVSYLLQSAYNFVKRQPTQATNTDKTEFGKLTGTATIRNGVISNNDLYLDSSRFDTKGNGTIDLVNQKINYRLQSALKQDNNETKKLKDLPIPILIAGNLNNPSIQLDTDFLMKALAQQQLQNAKKKVQEKIEQKLLKGAKLPDGAAQLLNNVLGQ